MSFKKNNRLKARVRYVKNTNTYEWKRIAYFFDFFDEEGPKELLWDMLKLALTSQEDDGEPSSRSSMIFFYEHTVELFANIHTILKSQLK